MADLSRCHKFIVALDTYDLDKIDQLLGVLKGRVSIFKIGFQLFTRYGTDIVRKVQNAGYDVFLDLKFHDIPNTVAKGVESARELGVLFTTVHAAGGSEMLAAASRAAGPEPRPHILGVTVLTSMDDASVREIGFHEPVSTLVPRFAGMVRLAGCHGVICSPHEIESIRSQSGPGFLIVTPGIRFTDSAADDQKRTMGPAEAIRKGADFLVIGRPVLQADDPAAFIDRCTREIDA